jgi:hypothetical protein
MIGDPTGHSIRNQSVACLLARLFVVPEAGAETPPVRIAVADLPRPAVRAAYVVLMGAAALALVAFAWRLRRSSSDRVEAGVYALCVGAMIWFSPWLMTYYFSLAIWPFAAVVGYLASADREQRSPRLPFAALVVWFAVMPALASPRLLACGVTLAAVALLLATLAALIGREARRRPEAA